MSPARLSRSFGKVLGLFVCAAVTCACALTSKSESLIPRFYTPEPMGARPASSASSAPSARKEASGLELRVGRITAVDDLRENIAFRDGDHEVGYYDERLWTERPEAYLARALQTALFEERGLRHVLSGPSPTLDVQLLAFEEIRTEPRRVRVRAAITLHDDKFVRVEETIILERPLIAKGETSDPDEVAKALGETLAAVVRTIADHVEIALRPQ